MDSNQHPIAGSHSRIGPSSAFRWGAPDGCPASVQMQETYGKEDPDRTAANEGDASHHVVATVLSSYLPSSTGLVTSASMIGTVHEKTGTVITKDMVEGADVCIRDVLDIVQEMGALQSLRIEQTIPIPRIHRESYGTPDICLVFQTADGNWWVFIWDYKYGRRVVSAFENWQGINYAAGVMPNNAECTVVIRIVQPRAYHAEGPVREWRLKGTHIRAHFNVLIGNAEDALSANPTVRTGTHCRDCTARLRCGHNQQAGADAAEYSGTMEPLNMTPAEMGTELAYLKRAEEAIKFRLAALETEVIVNVKAGKLALGWGIGSNRGSRKWKRPVAEIAALGEAMGVQLLKDPEPITPTQAVKLIGEDLVNAYSQKLPGSLKLTKDNPREVFSK